MNVSRDQIQSHFLKSIIALMIIITLPALVSAITATGTISGTIVSPTGVASADSNVWLDENHTQKIPLTINDNSALNYYQVNTTREEEGGINI